MTPLKRILLAEDNANDIELTLEALEEYNLANEVVVVRDGVELLDYLFQRGQFAGHANGVPAACEHQRAKRVNSDASLPLS